MRRLKLLFAKKPVKEFEAAGAWEASEYERRQASEKRAWWIALGLGGIAVLEALALLGLTPLKHIEPMIVRVDRLSGRVDVVSSLRNPQETYEEAVNKYFIARYLQAREGYFFDGQKNDRRVVGLYSSPAASKAYKDLTDPKKTREAPILVYGAKGTAKIHIQNITFLNNKTALVRYRKDLTLSSLQKREEHWVATLSFHYVAAGMSPEDRLVNPLGFQVTSYRNDPETQ